VQHTNVRRGGFAEKKEKKLSSRIESPESRGKRGLAGALLRHQSKGVRVQKGVLRPEKGGRASGKKGSQHRSSERAADGTESESEMKEGAALRAVRGVRAGEEDQFGHLRPCRLRTHLQVEKTAFSSGEERGKKDQRFCAPFGDPYLLLTH